MGDGVTPDELATAYPHLYHMAAIGSWPSIKHNGLLSTESLVSLFELSPKERAELLTRHRPRGVSIEHPQLGVAWIRDQIPMSDEGLTRCLQDGLTPKLWYELLNSKVFFWLTEERLVRLLSAKAYRADRHTVLVLDTRSLVSEFRDQIVLSPINSGCTKPFPHPRGLKTFAPLTEYPFRKWTAKRKLADAVVELAVNGAVPDVERFVIEVREQRGNRESKIIWKRARD